MVCPCEGHVGVSSVSVALRLGGARTLVSEPHGQTKRDRVKPAEALSNFAS